MFHANAWGLPYAALMAGAALVMPDRFLQAEPLDALIAAEQADVAGAVPTIWNDVLHYLEEHRSDISSSALGGLRWIRGAARDDAGASRSSTACDAAGVGHDRDPPLATMARPLPGVADDEAWGSAPPRAG